jgi:hypothetical protein
MNLSQQKARICLVIEGGSNIEFGICRTRKLSDEDLSRPKAVSNEDVTTFDGFGMAQS